MTRSLKVDFMPGGKLRLDTSSEIKNEQSMIRSVAINLLSKSGSDPIFPSRGTNLGWTSFRNLVLQATDISGLTKLAAIDTLFFVRETSILDAADKPEDIQLTPTNLESNSIEVELACVTVDGRQVSYPITT